MREVARAAGVSLATVSYVVNEGPRPVSSDRRKRVLAAIAELAYEPGARGRRRRRAPLIGALVPDATNAFFSSVLEAAEGVLRQQGHMLLVASSGDNPARELEQLAALRRAGVDGLLLTPAGDPPPAVEAVARRGFPVVLMDRDGGCSRLPRVVMANYRDAFRAVRVLAESGHRCIALVNGPETVCTARDRLRGYADALAHGGLALRPEYVRAGPFTREHGRQAAAALMSMPRAPEAIFSSSAILTVGLIQGLREQRLRWPDDVAVIGYGDPPWAALLHPPLTVIDQPSAEVGRTAARLLLSAGGTREPRRLLLDSSLVLRESHWWVERATSDEHPEGIGVP
jgi:DNA-binding LacI/PurR family transcriptional regulator